MSAPLTQPQQKACVRRRILVVGSAAHGISGALQRLDKDAEFHAVANGSQAAELLEETAFDHVLVDSRVDGTTGLAIPSLLQMPTVGSLSVLANQQIADATSAMPGIGRVLTAPFNPLEIAASVGITPQQAANRPTQNATQSRPYNPVFKEPDETPEEDARPHLTRGLIALANFIPGFTPIISALYKNLALVVLAALFMAFVSYGIMIAFFLTSDDWSSPLQLQRGHELVLKAERELGELKVKRNLVTQKLADARSKAERGTSALKRAETLAHIANVTITQEIQNREARYELIKSELADLEQLIQAYGPSDRRTRERDKLARDYKRRVLTRHVYEQSLLNLAQIEKTLVSLREQTSRKRTEAMVNRQSISYLGQLKAQLTETHSIPITAGNAAFVPIANQIIEVNQIRVNAKSDIAEFEATSAVLESSDAVLRRSIAELEATPMIDALDKAVNVLFVPYDNLGSYQENERLYTCAFAVFWCTRVGEVGKPISGEIVTTHPFFGKPIRGQFVEANLTETSAAQKEIIHVGRPPFFF